MPPENKNKTDTNTKTQIEPIRINFNKEDSRKFKELQTATGINAKSDLLRFCISFTHNIYLKKIIQETEVK